MSRSSATMVGRDLTRQGSKSCTQARAERIPILTENWLCAERPSFRLLLEAIQPVNRLCFTVWICRLNITPTSPRLTPCLRFSSVEQVNQQTGKRDREYCIPVGSRPIEDRRCDHENRPLENSNAGRLDSRRAGDSNLSSDDFRQSHRLDCVRRGWKRKQSRAGGEAPGIVAE